jgi:hypothetical protein
MAVQIGGFVICMGLLWWCIDAALRPENEEKLARVFRAPPMEVALLLGLSVLSLLLNGATFWLVLHPVRALRFWDLQAVNATAAFVSYAPAKLSILYRIFVHTRKDHVPVLTIGAWLGAVAVILLGTLVPLIGAAVWRQQADAMFYVACGGGLLGMFALIVGGARVFAGSQGLARIQRLSRVIPLAMVERLMHSAAFARLHSAFDMLASPRVVGGGLLIRVADLLVQAGRFVVAAHILGVELRLDTAILAACTFYVIGVASPSGSLGARESATTGLAGLLAIPGLDHAAFLPIALTVSATEIVINATTALVGVLWIQPWKLLTSSRQSGSR